MFISPSVRFKPSVMLRGTQGAPLSMDLNASINFKEFYTAGIFTRNFKTFGLLTQLSYKAFKIGYVLELPSSSTSSLNFVSHEVSLGISLGVLGFHDLAHKTFWFVDRYSLVGETGFKT